MRCFTSYLKKADMLPARPNWSTLGEASEARNGRSIQSRRGPHLPERVLVVTCRHGRVVEQGGIVGRSRRSYEIQRQHAFRYPPLPVTLFKSIQIAKPSLDELFRSVVPAVHLIGDEV